MATGKEPAWSLVGYWKIIIPTLITDVQVRFCSMSGEVVNGKVSSMRCLEEKHAIERRKMNKFYVNCGKQLII